MTQKITRTVQGTLYIVTDGLNEFKVLNPTAKDMLSYLSDGYTIKDEREGDFLLELPLNTFVSIATIKE